MSVARTIDRLARVVRQEARRNPDFAARLDAALSAHQGRGTIAADVEDGEGEAPPPAPALNPIALAAREGDAALAAALAPLTVEELRRLVSEHNLDPAGEAASLDASALRAHICAQARRRVERDKKLFDY